MKLFLFLLTAFVALTAIVSGALLISYPDGSVFKMSTGLLKGTPFSNFLVPGILLTVLVGGTNFVAVIYNMQRHPLRYNWAIAGAMVTIGWIVIQMLLLYFLHWLHIVYLLIGLMMILLAYQLKGKWAV
jgi:hypothetical protein